MPTIPLLIAFVAAHVPAQAPAPTAASLVSKMFARYAGAKTFSGTIKTTQTARGVSVVTNTAVVYERPAKIHVEQLQTGRDLKRASTLVSDGTDWVYSKPEGLFGEAKYLKESVAPLGRPIETINDFYGVVGSELPDRSVALDLIVARPADLKHFRDALVSFAYKGKTTVGGRAVHQIVGTARDTKVLGTFELDLTDDGDIVRYALTQTFAVPAASGRGSAASSQDSIVVSTVWDVAGTVGATIPAGAFKLPSA